MFMTLLLKTITRLHTLPGKQLLMELFAGHTVLLTFKPSTWSSRVFIWPHAWSLKVPKFKIYNVSVYTVAYFHLFIFKIFQCYPLSMVCLVRLAV